MGQVKIRMAKEDDCAKFLRIYAPYVTETAITFEYDVPTQAEFLNRIRSIAAQYPYLAAEKDGKIIGYAYAHRFAERAAYGWGAELSVYLQMGEERRGTGSALYRCLIELLKLQGVKTVYGCVTYPNENSERLHEAMGFRRVGIMEKSGFKLGQWRDVVWFEKPIGDKQAAPEAIRNITEIPFSKVEEILAAQGK